MPRVSIGMPVYNGAAYLRSAIESILSQTFDDFELIISDNASTDKTEKICREYSSQDPRIRYYRNQHNLGAAQNYNLTFQASTGEYFKWAAHDDLCAPDFLIKCVQVMDNEPDLVLCYPRARVINSEGTIVHNYDFQLNGTSVKPSSRMRYQIRGHQCYEIFGLFRSKFLKTTSLIGHFAGSDAVLLVQLCLLGRFHEIPEYLFFPRKHEKQSMALRKNFKDFATWFDPQKKGQIIFPYWKILSQYIFTVYNSRLSMHERFLCLLIVGSWILKRTRPLTMDLIAAGFQIINKYKAKTARLSE